MIDGVTIDARSRLCVEPGLSPASPCPTFRPQGRRYLAHGRGRRAGLEPGTCRPQGRLYEIPAGGAGQGATESKPKPNALPGPMPRSEGVTEFIGVRYLKNAFVANRAQAMPFAISSLTHIRCNPA